MHIGWEWFGGKNDENLSVGDKNSPLVNFVTTEFCHQCSLYTKCKKALVDPSDST